MAMLRSGSLFAKQTESTATGHPHIGSGDVWNEGKFNLN